MLTKSSLSIPQKRLIETMQEMNFGRIENLAIRGGEPILSPAPRVVKDVKLGSDNGARPELQCDDFALKREHIELFENLRRLGDGVVERIDIKGGLPFRITVEQQI